MSCKAVAEAVSRFVRASALDADDGGGAVTMALLGDDASIDRTIREAVEAFESKYGKAATARIGRGEGEFNNVKGELANFVINREQHELKHGQESGHSLVILDDFAKASTADVSSLHGAWERERPFLRYRGETYDMSGIVFMPVYRGERLANAAEQLGWKSAIEQFYESLVRADSKEGSMAASSLTPAAAVGRIGRGFVMEPYSSNDCRFVLPARDSTRSSFGHPLVYLALLPIIFALWRHFGAKGLVVRDPSAGGDEKRGTQAVKGRQRATSVGAAKPGKKRRNKASSKGSNMYKMKKVELQEELERRGVKFRKSAKKSELVDLLEQSDM